MLGLLYADAEARLLHGGAGVAQGAHQLLVELAGAEGVELLVDQGDAVAQLVEPPQIAAALLLCVCVVGDDVIGLWWG